MRVIDVPELRVPAVVLHDVLRLLGIIIRDAEARPECLGDLGVRHALRVPLQDEDHLLVLVPLRADHDGGVVTMVSRTSY